MATYYKSQGLIVDKTDRGEADQIFKIYTKDFGKLSILAKAIRKSKSKLRGGADFLYLSDIEFIQGRNQKTLTDASLLESFQGIRGSLKKTKIAVSIVEVIDKLIGHEEADEKIWQLLWGSLLELDKGEEGKSGLLYYYFLWNFFSTIGYLPQLYSCSVCNKKIFPGVLHFSSAEGGIVCWQCSLQVADNFRAEEDLIKVLRVILSNNWKSVSRLKISPYLNKLLKEASQHYLDEIFSKLNSQKSQSLV